MVEKTKELMVENTKEYPIIGGTWQKKIGKREALNEQGKRWAILFYCSRDGLLSIKLLFG